MKSINKSLLSIICVCSLMLSSCGVKKNNVVQSEGKYDGKYPINSETTLSWYIPLESNAAQSVKNLGDTAFAQELKKKSGVDVEYIHPSTSGSAEQFNLMLSSEKLPDMISHYWTDFPGGAEKAISEGYILDITDLIDKYAPNYKKFLEENPEFKKWVTTDEGRMFGFPSVQAATATGGLIIRQDWLDELGLKMPETLEEWENTLTEFKNKKGARAPLSCDVNAFRNGAFASPFGIELDWYADNGEIKYGYYEDGYKDFLELMRDWYKKGLYDNNFSTQDSKVFSANILSGASGVSYGGITSGIGLWNSTKKDSEPSYKVVSAPWPVKNKGDLAEFGQLSPEITVFSTALSTSCKDPELAVRLLDYTYSEEGMYIYNYGVEGESYTIVNGKPVFTDKILKPQDGKTIGQVLSYYAKPYNTYNSIQIYDAYEQTLLTEEMKNALNVWSKSNQKEHLVPPLYPTEEEQAKYASLQNSIDTYVKEMFIKFVMGIESIDKFDDYRKTLEDLGIKELLQLKNAAYKRALNR